MTTPFQIIHPHNKQVHILMCRPLFLLPDFPSSFSFRFFVLLSGSEEDSEEEEFELDSSSDELESDSELQGKTWTLL